MERTLEEKKQLVKDLCPIDDVCFEVLASNKDNEMEKIKRNKSLLEDSSRKNPPGTVCQFHL